MHNLKYLNHLTDWSPNSKFSPAPLVVPDFCLQLSTIQPVIQPLTTHPTTYCENTVLLINWLTPLHTKGLLLSRGDGNTVPNWGKNKFWQIQCGLWRKRASGCTQAQTRVKVHLKVWQPETCGQVITGVALGQVFDCPWGFNQNQSLNPTEHKHRF